ncbi:YbaN family protein [Phyllobacterium sp. 21LDTY02-6]|uniref:YbaN family protein n=1 Tax=unclassified Phyllobacterium TaxID=2638441 RepID=UPI002022390D|nr:MULTISPECIES: YbaN family protein [unclassified Phyllobacterium]MCO4319404.1 YbaN family protein [Phyllobacterium sp. 21LDTY02-6]MCX8295562.1 YbaN family protein [Phyllobacterium sp. 0TCS1.6A]
MGRTKRTVYFVVGWIMVALGFVGALLPVMPTTIFLIIAAWCFSRSSPRFENWLLTHPVFGPTLVKWRQSGAIPGRIKLIALAGMAFGFGSFYYFARPTPALAGFVALFFIASAVYVVTRPSV